MTIDADPKGEDRQRRDHVSRVAAVTSLNRSSAGCLEYGGLSCSVVVYSSMRYTILGVEIGLMYRIYRVYKSRISRRIALGCRGVLGGPAARIEV